MTFGSRNTGTNRNNKIIDYMKKLTLAVLAALLVFSGENLSAQGKYGADSSECIKYLSYYKEYYKQKSYDSAIPSWRNAYRICPATASQNLLIEGTTLVKRLIVKNAKNAEYRKALVDTLVTLYKTRAEVYPKYAVTAYNNLGLDLANFAKNDFDRLYTEYENIIARNGNKTKAQLLLFDMNAVIELYQNGKLGAEEVINIYQRNSDILDSIEAKDDGEAEQNSKIKADMGSLFVSSKVASCDNLIELFTPRYEAEPDNLQLATSIVKTMSLTEDCTGNDLFLKAVTTMNRLNPSSSSAYYLYKLHAGKDEFNEAAKYLEEAIASDETDVKKDAELTFELAAFCFKNGHSAQAFSNAEKAAALDDAFAGKAYFLIANIWASASCGSGEMERRAHYWVASDYMAKAKAADPSLAEEANRYMGQYRSYFPQTAEAFMYDLQDGQPYKVVCGGMSATTTVRTIK